MEMLRRRMFAGLLVLVCAATTSGEPISRRHCWGIDPRGLLIETVLSRTVFREFDDSISDFSARKYRFTDHVEGVTVRAGMVLYARSEIDILNVLSAEIVAALPRVPLNRIDQLVQELNDQGGFRMRQRQLTPAIVVPLREALSVLSDRLFAVQDIGGQRSVLWSTSVRNRDGIVIEVDIDGTSGDVLDACIITIAERLVDFCSESRSEEEIVRDLVEVNARLRALPTRSHGRGRLESLEMPEGESKD